MILKYYSIVFIHLFMFAVGFSNPNEAKHLKHKLNPLLGKPSCPKAVNWKVSEKKWEKISNKTKKNAYQVTYGYVDTVFIKKILKSVGMKDKGMRNPKAFGRLKNIHQLKKPPKKKPGQPEVYNDTTGIISALTWNQGSKQISYNPNSNMFNYIDTNVGFLDTNGLDTAKMKKAATQFMKSHFSKIYETKEPHNWGGQFSIKNKKDTVWGYLRYEFFAKKDQKPIMGNAQIASIGFGQGGKLKTLEFTYPLYSSAHKFKPFKKASSMKLELMQWAKNKCSVMRPDQNTVGVDSIIIQSASETYSRLYSAQDFPDSLFKTNKKGGFTHKRLIKASANRIWLMPTVTFLIQLYPVCVDPQKSQYCQPSFQRVSYSWLNGERLTRQDLERPIPPPPVNENPNGRPPGVESPK